MNAWIKNEIKDPSPGTPRLRGSARDDFLPDLFRPPDISDCGE